MEKLEMVVSVHTESAGRLDKEKTPVASVQYNDIVLVEKTRPIASPCHSAEKAEDTIAGMLRLRPYSRPPKLM